MKYTIAIGDIHGCYHEMTELFVKLSTFMKQNENNFQIVFLGDYIDRGPNSKEVVDKIMEMQRTLPYPVIALKGNHEDMLINAYNNIDHGTWARNGGKQTFDSFEIKHIKQLDVKYFHWFNSLPVKFETKVHLFVHAGINPYYSFDDQIDHDLMWIRHDFLLWKDRFDKYVVHGHTPFVKAQVKDNRCSLDTGCVFENLLTAAIFEDGIEKPVDIVEIKSNTKYKH